MSFRAVALVALIAGSAAGQTLRGSPQSVELMYSTAHTRDLQFMRTSADIYEAARVGALKLISMTDDLELLRTTWPFVLPNTLRFTDSLAAQYRAACGERLTVTSGARPTSKQPRNASPKSVHPTGMAVDFRRPQNPACLTWLRKSLVELEQRGVIEATEERRPPHFHVAVLRQVPVPHVQMAAGDVQLTPVKRVKAAKAHAKAHVKKPVKKPIKKGSRRR
jgi:hypothetical protein